MVTLEVNQPRVSINLAENENLEGKVFLVSDANHPLKDKLIVISRVNPRNSMVMVLDDSGALFRFEQINNNTEVQPVVLNEVKLTIQL